MNLEHSPKMSLLNHSGGFSNLGGESWGGSNVMVLEALDESNLNADRTYFD